MFVLSKKSSSGYEPVSIHYNFTSLKFTLLDELLSVYIKNPNIVLRDEISRLRDIPNSTEVKKEMFALNHHFKVTPVVNKITSETAVIKISKHIRKRFSELASTTKTVCIREKSITNEMRRCWSDLDPHNSVEAIRHIEAVIEKELNTLRAKGIHIKYGILTSSSKDYECVKFTNSYEYNLNRNAFCIVVSPCSGYEKMLETSPQSKD